MINIKKKFLNYITVDDLSKLFGHGLYLGFVYGK